MVLRGPLAGYRYPHSPPTNLARSVGDGCNASRETTLSRLHAQRCFPESRGARTHVHDGLKMGCGFGSSAYAYASRGWESGFDYCSSHGGDDGDADDHHLIVILNE